LVARIAAPIGVLHAQIAITKIATYAFYSRAKHLFYSKFGIFTTRSPCY
jgi:hypothetical protein